jgi:hypothetical protein
VHELVEPFSTHLLAKSRNVEWKGFFLLPSYSVCCKSVRQFDLGDIPEVRLIIFLELVLSLQV